MVYARLLFLFVTFSIAAIFSAFCSLFISFPHPVFVKTKKWIYFVFYRILGGRIKKDGVINTEKTVLFIANHVSYIDILVFGQLISDASFISKEEVSRWPLVSTLAKIHGSIFVSRTRSSVKRQLNIIQQALKEKRRLILFPEGTSSDGTHVQPLKSSFLNFSGIGPVTIQPVTISYTHLHGIPIGRAGRWLYAWFGDENLLSHMKHIISASPFLATVNFHPSFEVTDVCRKSLTKHCEKVLNSGLESTINEKSFVEIPPTPTNLAHAKNI